MTLNSDHDHRRRLLFFLGQRTNSLPPLLSLLLEVGPLNTARGSGEHCKLPQWGLGQSPSWQTIWCILESKSAALVAAVFVDFPNNKCNFLHKNKLDIVRQVQFLGQSPPLPYGSRRLCLWGINDNVKFQSHRHGDHKFTSPKNDSKISRYQQQSSHALHKHYKYLYSLERDHHK